MILNKTIGYRHNCEPTFTSSCPHTTCTLTPHTLICPHTLMYPYSSHPHVASPDLFQRADGVKIGATILAPPTPVISCSTNETMLSSTLYASGNKWYTPEHDCLIKPDSNIHWGTKKKDLPTFTHSITIYIVVTSQFTWQCTKNWLLKRFMNTQRNRGGMLGGSLCGEALVPGGFL